jgi:hypothetical protein
MKHRSWAGRGGWFAMINAPHKYSSQSVWFALYVGKCSHGTRWKVQLKVGQYDFVVGGPRKPLRSILSSVRPWGRSQ